MLLKFQKCVYTNQWRCTLCFTHYLIPMQCGLLLQCTQLSVTVIVYWSMHTITLCTLFIVQSERCFNAYQVARNFCRIQNGKTVLIIATGFLHSVSVFVVVCIECRVTVYIDIDRGLGCVCSLKQPTPLVVLDCLSCIIITCSYPLQHHTGFYTSLRASCVDMTTHEPNHSTRLPIQILSTHHMKP